MLLGKHEIFEIVTIQRGIFIAFYELPEMQIENEPVPISYVLFDSYLNVVSELDLEYYDEDITKMIKPILNSFMIIYEDEYHPLWLTK